VAVVWGWFPWRRTAVRRRVIVNLPDKAFEAILWAKRGPLLVLRNVVLHMPDAVPRDLDAEVIVERRMVEFIQVLPKGG